MNKVAECPESSESGNLSKRVILVESPSAPLQALKESLQQNGYAVVNCHGGFDALDKLSLEGADILISSTSLSDINGYQLSCLLKSTEKTAPLPVVLIKSEGEAKDSLWPAAIQADVVLSFKESRNPDKLVLTIKELIEKSRQQGWIPSLAKNPGAPVGSFSSSNPTDSFKSLVSELLTGRLIGKLTRSLCDHVEPHNHFLEKYFSLSQQLFHCHLYGFILAAPNNPWAAYKLEPGYSKQSFNELTNKVYRQLEIHKAVHMNIFGELAENGKPLPPPEVLPVRGEKGILGALVFSAANKKGFDPPSRAAISQLQLQMQPVMSLLLARQEVESFYQQEQYRASTDPLTGLYNLEFLVGFLQQQLLFSFRQRSPVGVILIDIDNFKNINDEFGHELGDTVLSTIANRLLNETRGSDLLARYGGDEFAVVLPNTDANGTRVVAEKIRLEIENMSFLSGGSRRLHVTVSSGCASFNLEDLNPETILRDAKLAMLRAKKAGRNRVSD